MSGKLLQEIPIGYGMTGKQLPDGRWDTWDGSQCGCGPRICANRVGCKEGNDVMVFDGYEETENGLVLRCHMEPQPTKAK